jgi:hypothetical protein
MCSARTFDPSTVTISVSDHKCERSPRVNSIEHPSRQACDPSGSKTRGRLIIFETLVAVEQPNKKDA